MPIRTHKHLLFQFFSLHFVINIIPQFLNICLFNLAVLLKPLLNEFFALIAHLQAHILCHHCRHLLQKCGWSFWSILC